MVYIKQMDIHNISNSENVKAKWNLADENVKTIRYFLTASSLCLIKENTNDSYDYMLAAYDESIELIFKKL